MGSESGGENMEIAESARALEVFDGSADAESECAKALAEAERVLDELSLTAPRTRRSSSVDEKSSGQSGDPLPSVDRLRLDPGLDFVVHDDGVIELTEAGFRRMVQAHSAGLDAVIGIDGHDVLRLPAPKLGRDSCIAGVAEMR
jgi:acetylornithine deacetylase/succinyl-diaminopimelate desuccinylase-like protein